MMRPTLSKAATSLLRALCNRAGVPRDRIYLMEFVSSDWCSLTYTGERHEISLRIPGHDARDAADRLTNGLEEAEIDLSGYLLADIALQRRPMPGDDGSIAIEIEALTLDEA